mmetsp:Transcript_10990/g.21521  ORF Transcript_10990/g.21521 Transcript_10990/m.21521 type:complete len:91 (+) Transcript_10990:141-413(+)
MANCLICSSLFTTETELPFCCVVASWVFTQMETYETTNCAFCGRVLHSCDVLKVLPDELRLSSTASPSNCSQEGPLTCKSVPHVGYTASL